MISTRVPGKLLVGDSIETPNLFAEDITVATGGTFTDLIATGTSSLGASTLTSLTVGVGGITMATGSVISGDLVSSVSGTFENLHVVGELTLDSGVDISGVDTLTATTVDVETVNADGVICNGALSAATIASPSGGFTNLIATGTSSLGAATSTSLTVGVGGITMATGSVISGDLVSSVSGTFENLHVVGELTLENVDITGIDAISCETVETVALNADGIICTGALSAGTIASPSVGATALTVTGTSSLGAATATSLLCDDISSDTLTVSTELIMDTFAVITGDVNINGEINVVSGGINGNAISASSLVCPILTGPVEHTGTASQKTVHYTGSGTRTSVAPFFGLSRQVIVDDFTNLGTTPWSINGGNSLGLSQLKFFLTTVDGHTATFCINAGFQGGVAHGKSGPYGAANGVVTQLNGSDFSVTVNGTAGTFTLVLTNGDATGTLQFSTGTTGTTRLRIERTFM